MTETKKNDRAKRVARMEEMRNAYKTLTGNPQTKIPLTTSNSR